MQKVIVLSIAMFCIFSTSCRDKRTAEAVIPYQNVGDSLQQVLELSYVGNMGVLVESQGNTVLFDGFHKEYGPDYVYPPKQLVTELQRGLYNGFSKIEVICVTHKHGDHFDSEYCHSFLAENREAIVIGPTQVHQEIVALESEHNEKVAQSVRPIAYNNEIHAINHQGIDIKAIQCNHVNPKRHASIENIAYLVEINGFKVLHVGDTNWNEASQTFITLELKNTAIDIAILPYWMLYGDSAKERVQKLIGAKHIIATHVPPSFTQDEKQELRQAFTNITVFTQLGEYLTYKKNAK